VLLIFWIVADLVLVVVLVVLAKLPVDPAGARVSAPASSAAAGTPKPVAPGMGQPVVFRVAVTPASLGDPARAPAAQRNVLAAVRGRLADLGLTGKQAGFVEVFACGSLDKIGLSVKVAQAVLENLRHEEPVAFGNAGGDAYWGGAGNDLMLKIFFYN